MAIMTITEKDASSVLTTKNEFADTDCNQIIDAIQDGDKQIKTKGIVIAAETDNGDSGAIKTIDWTTSDVQKITLSANCTFTFTDPLGIAKILVLKVIQDGTGSRTVTWDADVEWAGGTAPTLTTTAAHVDVIYFIYDGSKYYGQTILDLS